MIEIKTAQKEINKFGARKYADVPSFTENKIYKVVKCRKRGAKHYFYVCTCPVNLYLRKTCKHIIEFKKAEKG